MIVNLHNQKYEVVPVSKLSEHPMNPRKGDVAAIESSLKFNGFYGAVVAQKSTGHVLVGNHRFRKFVENGAKKIPCFMIDVPDDEAVAIMLADNKLVDASKDDYDDVKLHEALSSIPSLGGTGFDEAFLESLDESLVPKRPAEYEGSSAENLQLWLKFGDMAVQVRPSEYERWKASVRSEVGYSKRAAIEFIKSKLGI